ncbi:hypothetical protein HF086_009114 [Spodoptera exigua]|uniref:Uncharacterized protein n=1 Tax=Spodoptera exigua TaxID=7107 RepID=A0A922SIR3_SPOEX|nr:hypothetical protein HF086_009114 [Spodoptera exigua]
MVPVKCYPSTYFRNHRKQIL